MTIMAITTRFTTRKTPPGDVNERVQAIAVQRGGVFLQYEYWTCTQTYGADWSCNGDVDKSDFGYEYWDCTQTYGGDWSCSGDGRKAIFSTPVPIAVT